MTVNGILMISLVLPMVVQAGQVVLEQGPLFDFREGGKATFLRSVDPQEHVRGMASIGNQTEGVLNARQEFCGHYLDLCATYWQLDRCERALANGRLVVSAAGQAMSDEIGRAHV